MNVIKTEPNLGSNIKKDLKKSFKINEKSEDKINQTNNKNINNAFFETTEVTDESKKKEQNCGKK